MCTHCYISPEQASIEREWHIGRANSDPWLTQVFARKLAGTVAQVQALLKLPQTDLFDAEPECKNGLF